MRNSVVATPFLCCPVQGKSFKGGRTLIQEMSRHIYRRDTQRSGLRRCYVMTSATLSPTLRRNTVQLKSLTRKMKVLHAFETSVTLYQSVQHNSTRDTVLRTSNLLRSEFKLYLYDQMHYSVYCVFYH